MIHFRTLACMVTALTLVGVSLRADEPAAGNEPTAAEAAEGNVSPAQIDAWIKQLDSDSFKQREAATGELSMAGEAAIEALAKAAEGSSFEVTTRAIGILKKHFLSEDAQLKPAAAAALKKLEKSETRSVASAAADALKATPKVEPAQPQPPPFGNLRIFGGARIIGGAGGVVRIQVRNANGDRDIEVTENGKTVKITENARDGITVQRTEKVDGKEKTQKWTAKNKEELKKKHADAFKLYEQHSGLGAIRIGGIRMQQAIPVAPGLPPNVEQQLEAQIKRIEAQFKAMEKQREVFDRILDIQKRRVEALKKDGDPADAVDKTIQRHKARVDALEARNKQLEAQLEKLRKQLKEEQQPNKADAKKGDDAIPVTR